MCHDVPMECYGHIIIYSSYSPIIWNFTVFGSGWEAQSLLVCPRHPLNIFILLLLPPRCAHPASFRSLPLGLKLDHNDTNDTGLYICIIRIGWHWFDWFILRFGIAGFSQAMLNPTCLQALHDPFLRCSIVVSSKQFSGSKQPCASKPDKG